MEGETVGLLGDGEGQEFKGDMEIEQFQHCVGQQNRHCHRSEHAHGRRMSPIKSTEEIVVTAKGCRLKDHRSKMDQKAAAFCCCIELH